MQSLSEVSASKEIIVKRISASKFEVYDGSSLPPEKTESPPKPTEKVTEKEEQKREEVVTAEPLLPRQTVIRRAPPAAKNSTKTEDESPAKKRKTENYSAGASPGVILIKDAIMYRIVDILMWKVVGENQLKTLGYPLAPTHQVLCRFLHQNSLRSGAKKIEIFPQDHDCGGNIGCFTNHVYQFLEICAPNLWRRTGWGKLSIEEVLRRIYYEDLIPFLRSIYLRNNATVLQCHSDIVLLEKWEKQKFTAVTWSGQKYFSQMSLNCPRCPQCSNRHF